MRRARRVRTASVLGLLLAASTMLSAESNQKVFERSWVGRRVIVNAPLYSLVYKERSVLGSIRGGRDGLTVVTPFAGTYFQFDGRRRVDDVMEHDVQKIAESVTRAYQKSTVLDEGWVQVIEPVMLARYDRGTELVVRAARVRLDTVRLELSLPADSENDLVTSLTVQWPAPLSKAFSERVNVEDLIHQFLTTRE